MNTQSDTPETDGEWNRLACQDHPEFERNLANFARKMERERNELRAAIRNLRDVKGRHHTQIATERLFELLEKSE